MAKHPEWALKHKRPHTELRLIRGRYYLYEVSSKWNPEKGRAQKITGKFLGTITEEDGFIESKKQRLLKEVEQLKNENKNPQIKKLSVKEYGITKYIDSYLNDYKQLLMKHFPDNWAEIICLTYGRLTETSALKNMFHHYEHSYLSVLYPKLDLSARSVGELLKNLGYDRERILAFIHEFRKANDCILFDGTDIKSHSKKLMLNQDSKCKDGTFDKALNQMYIFSVGLQVPIYYRTLPGKVTDVKSFKYSLQESRITDATIITDKGFYSDGNIRELDEEKLNYLMPLRRNSHLIDYSIMKSENKKLFEGYFEFEKRFIWYYSIPAEQGKKVFIFLDQELKTTEEKDYLNRISDQKENYSIEDFYEVQHKFGTISFLTNTNKSGREIYTDYKNRGAIEQMIDTLKNVLEADKTYMQNEQTLEGWSFINYLALHWYYKILNLLKEKEVNNKFSPHDFLIKLKEVRKVKINDKWYLAETTKKTLDLLTNLGINIT